MLLMVRGAFAKVVSPVSRRPEETRSARPCQTLPSPYRGAALAALGGTAVAWGPIAGRGVQHAISPQVPILSAQPSELLRHLSTLRGCLNKRWQQCRFGALRANKLRAITF
jgi:hypothetical protein